MMKSQLFSIHNFYNVKVSLFIGGVVFGVLFSYFIYFYICFYEPAVTTTKFAPCGMIKVFLTELNPRNRYTCPYPNGTGESRSLGLVGCGCS